MALIIQVWKQLWQAIALHFNPILVPLLLFSLLVLFKLSRGGKINSPPSPPRLPIIGNFHQIGTAPHRSMRAMSEKYGPLMLLHFGSVPTLVVSSAEVAREVLRTHDTIFANRPQVKPADILFLGCTDVAFSSYGEYWKQAKKICVTEPLSLKQVHSFDFVREEEVAELVEKVRHSCLNGGSSVNLAKTMVTISNNIVCRAVLGQKYEGENGIDNFGETLRRALDHLVAFCFQDFSPYLGWIDILTGMNARLKESSKRLHALLDQIIDEHQISKGDKDKTHKRDFVDILLHLRNSGLLDIELTRDNLKSILLNMLIAGTDPAPVMEWAMAELVKNPSIMKKVQEEVRKVVGKKSKIDKADVNQMNYLKCVIKETIRLHSHFIIARESIASVTLAGYVIPPKTWLFIHSWAIHRDPKLWDMPEEFLPERFANDPIDFKGQDPRYCPFGAGRRGCPGISYAVMEMEYVIANLLYWFDWKLPNGATAENLDMDEAFGQLNHKKIPLTVVPALHTP